jgi:1,2-diacylglycerol 3-beta-galactosyltransferase
VVENGVGAFETDPVRIADIMATWLGPSPEARAEFAAMAKRSKALGRPRAVYNIARDLAGLVESAKELAVEVAAAAAAPARRACCSGGAAKQQPLVAPA